MKVILSALIGMFVCVFALPMVGFVVGGVGRAAPCHSAPDFISGALFGMMAFTYILFLPACGAGAVAGGIVGAVLMARAAHTNSPDPTVRLHIPRFTLRDMFYATTLTSVGLAGFFAPGKLLPLPSNAEENCLDLIIVYLGSSALIGAGLMAPFHRKLIGSVLGPLVAVFIHALMLVIETHR